MIGTVMPPVSVRTASASATSAISDWVTSRIFGRSRWSAKSPAKRPKTSRGNDADQADGPDGFGSVGEMVQLPEYRPELERGADIGEERTDDPATVVRVAERGESFGERHFAKDTGKEGALCYAPSMRLATQMYTLRDHTKTVKELD